MSGRYLRGFTERIGVQSFHSLKWSLTGGLLSSGALFALGIIAGRILGPTEFGAVGIIQTMAMIISTFMVAGLDVSVIHYTSKQREKSDVQKVISSSSLNAIVLLVAITSVALLLSGWIAQSLDVERVVVYAAIAFAISVTIKVLADGFLRSVGDFQGQAYNKVAESVLAVAAFLAIITAIRGHEAYVWALTLAALLYAGLSLYRVRSYFSWGSYSSATAKKIAVYGLTALISTILGLVFLYLDKIIVQLALGQQSLGLYMAYYTAAIMPISQLSGMVANVFYPLAAKSSDPAHILAFLHSAFLRFLVPTILFIAITGTVVMKLFGSQYSYEPKTLFLFSIWGGILFFASLYNFVIMGHSQKLFMIGLRFQVIKTVLFGAYLYLLVQMGALSITSIVIGLIFANLVEMMNCTLVLRWYGRKISHV